MTSVTATSPPSSPKGAHPAVIASRLGHTSVKTVLDVYGHLYEGLDRTAADTLNRPGTHLMRARRSQNEIKEGD